MSLPSLVHTGPSLLVKVAYDEGTERTIGYAANLTARVSQGQKEIFTVDSPFPQEIAQAAGPSLVRGQMTLFLPKGQTLESLGLVSYRTINRNEDEAQQAGSRYMALRIYDRLSGNMVMSIEQCKIGEYSINIAARQIVRCEVSFTGKYMLPFGG